MKLIIRNATIVAPGNKFHGSRKDIKIENGQIKLIADKIDAADGFEEFSGNNLHVSEGWFDTSVSLGEPGFEERETIVGGLNAAAAGGFTGVAVQPSSNPVTDNQAQVKLITTKAAGHAVNAHVIGALTMGSDGKDLAELYDMHSAGAIAFGDYNKNTDNANLMKIALQYTQDFGGTVIAFSQDKQVAGKGIVNEGISATQNGLRGIPKLAEELMVARNLQLLEYTGGRLHIPTISSPESVQLIKEAKSKGLSVTCSVAVHHLTLNDEVLSTFDTRYKVMPPLQDEETRLALIEAVKDGTIDCITSDHAPIDIEHKKLEFDYALYGTIGLESAYGALENILPTETIVEKLIAGRRIFGIESNFDEGQMANLTLFDPSETWTFSESDIVSKSKNSVFIGHAMTGKVLGIVSNGQLKTNKP